MKVDQRVLDAQKWLNANYTGKKGYTAITENGFTGNIVMEALVTALQIDLGVTTTGYFGPETAAAYKLKMVSKGSVDTDTSHFVTILQHGLYCKGYNPKRISGTFDDDTVTAISKIQTDAGLATIQIASYATPTIMKAVLSSDALVLVTGGDPIIRGIQQALNRNYISYIGIMPCDGFYGAGLAKSLNYALQAVGGMDVTTANGNFGTGTQTIATNHPQTPSSYESKFVLIAQYALYCNGIRRNAENIFNTSINGTFAGIYDATMTTAVTAFQTFVAIMEVTGTIGVKEWMSLLVSTGYPKRNVIASDTSTQITDVKALRIAANDFSIIGRYLTGATTAAPKNLTRAELQILFNRGISVFAIYQDEKAYYAANPNEYSTVNYYDYEQGLNDAEKACDAAIALGIPYNEYIFFSVDYDFNDAQVTSMIIPHFKGINEYMRKHGSKYKIGIYGPRNICTRVSNVSYAKLSFVSDMSTGFSGNLGYKLPENWAFDQIREYSQGAADGSFNLDCVAASGSYLGFKSIIPENILQNNVSNEDITLRFIKNVLNCTGLTVDEEIKFVDKKYPANFGAFSVEVEVKLGANIVMESDSEMTKVDIENGEFKKSSWTQVVDIVAGMSMQLSAGLTADNKIELAENLR